MTDDIEDIEDSDFHVTDLYAVKEYKTFDSKSPVHHFLEDVDVKKLVDEDAYKVFEQRSQIQENDENVAERDSYREMAKVIGKSKSTVERWDKKLRKQLNEAFDEYMEDKGKVFITDNLTYKIMEFLSDYKAVRPMDEFQYIYDFLISNYNYKIEEEINWEHLHKNQRDYTYTILIMLEELMGVENRELFIKLWKSIKGHSIDQLNDQDKIEITIAVMGVFNRYIAKFSKSEKILHDERQKPHLKKWDITKYINSIGETS